MNTMKKKHLSLTITAALSIMLSVAAHAQQSRPYIFSECSHLHNRTAYRNALAYTLSELKAITKYNQPNTT